MLLYLKPGVRGDEGAADIVAYARAHREFPNQSTGDQWFDEPQLESYRSLGYAIMSRIFDAAGRPTDLPTLFANLPGIDPKTLQSR
jgi:hypothetical protein